jgi:hypothetical protein
MDADDWLKTMEKKLQLVQCNNREKVLLTTHQLIGPTADWWDVVDDQNWQVWKSRTIWFTILEHLVWQFQSKAGEGAKLEDLKI